ncbi:protein capicua homolog, partial [Plakobranchus ocellatus]
MISPEPTPSHNSPAASNSDYQQQLQQQKEKHVKLQARQLPQDQQQHQQQQQENPKLQKQGSDSSSVSSEQDILSPTGQTKQKHKPPPLSVPSHVLQPPSSTSSSPNVVASPRKGIIKRSKDDQVDSVLGQVEFEKHFKDLPEFVPEETSATTPLLQSPRGILNAYKQKSKMAGLAKTGPDMEGAKSINESGTPTPKTPKSGHFDDRRFFGENFNIDLATTSSVPNNKLLDFDGDLNSPRTPKTPSSPGAFSNRRILDQRRQLVVKLFDEEGLFPT